MWRLLLGTMGVKSLIQGLNAAVTAGFEPRTVWSEVRRRNQIDHCASCPCMNASWTSYPLAIHKERSGMQRLPGERSWTVSRSAKRVLWQATKENESKPSITCVGDRRKSKKNPRRTQLACHRTAHIGHGQHVHWNPTVSKHEALTMDTSPTVRSTNNTLVFL